MKRSFIFFLLLLLFSSFLFSNPQEECRNNKKIKTLVLVIASDDPPIYQVFQKSWRAYMHLDPEHFECYFLRGNPNLPTLYSIEGDTVWTRSEESLVPGLLNKTVIGLEAFLPRLHEFDYVLRANLSSFFVFPRLLDFLETLPRSRCYSGIHHGIGDHRSSNGWVCGAGIIFSTDVVSLLLKHRSFFWDHLYVDDVAIGSFLADFQIPVIPIQFADLYLPSHWLYIRGSLPQDIFHFRVKTQTEGRFFDEVIHSELCKIYYGKTLADQETKKPRIALFFAGRVKGYEGSSSQLLDFIHKNSIDVFCSLNAPLDSYHREFLNLFGVKKHHFESFEVPEHLKIRDKAGETNLYNTCSMFYNQKKSIELIEEFQKETGIKYDLVIYMRADIIPRSFFDFALTVDPFLHIPAGQDFGGINDQMAWGSFLTMKKYCSLFDQISTYCNELDCLFHPETLLRFHLQLMGLSITRFDFPYVLNSARHR